MAGEEPPALERGFAPVDAAPYEGRPPQMSSIFAHFKAGPSVARGHAGDLPSPNPLDIPYTGVLPPTAIVSTSSWAPY